MTSNQKNSTIRSKRPGKIYAYEFPGVKDHEGYIKVGYTARDVAEERIREQVRTTKIRFNLLGQWEAVRNDGTSFNDHDVHEVLKENGFDCLNEPEGRNEWFKCTLDNVKAAIVAVQEGKKYVEGRTENFKMRPEQQDAVEKTKQYFESIKKEEGNRIPKFLWNAKMRFGKTFTAYQLAKAMKFTRVLILTFKPAVQSSWKHDLRHHTDFEGWQFIGPSKSQTIDEQYKSADQTKPIVCFGSFQDFLELDKNEKIKAKNKWVHETTWDLVILDEYHFGAWRENPRKLFEHFEQIDEDNYEENGPEVDKSVEGDKWLPIKTKHYLYLSGTPFRALNSGEFIEEQIFSWTYSDEQKAKENWPKDHPNEENPYAMLPKIEMYVYDVPEEIQNVSKNEKCGEFDLNIFFSAEGEGENAHFKNKEYVQKWLDLIHGSYNMAKNKGAIGGNAELEFEQKEELCMPYSKTKHLNNLSHTVWFLPNVASCCAMANLLKQAQNNFYHDYKIIVCAGEAIGVGAEAFEEVQKLIKSNKKTITLSCGKLMTGVTIRPWSGIFMLRNLSSPETYFQAAFRVQSPGEKGTKKEKCYIFDFAVNRALKRVAEYSRCLDIGEGNDIEGKIDNFIEYLPIIAYDGGKMRQIDAGEILDIMMSGTTAKILANQWNSPLLVNVDNATLERLLKDKKAMEALEHIEAFRKRGDDKKEVINNEVIINKSECIGDVNRKSRKSLTKEEREYRRKREEIREKLLKLAIRIPMFMYLTDHREKSLSDVIGHKSQSIIRREPALFKRVTGLDVKDFELLVALKVFNENKMDNAVLGFKRYEDPSLIYAGIDKHKDKQT